MKRWIWVALCLLMTVGIASGETKDELWKKIRIAANGWKQYKPSAQAIQRVKDCLMKSTSPEIITGWETILDPQTVAKAAAEKRAIHATVADGKMSDWKPPQAARMDATGDMQALNAQKDFNPNDAANDLTAFDFKMDDEWIVCYLKVKKMPEAGTPYHYRINLHSADRIQMVYAIVWSSSGNGIQEWDGNGNFIEYVPIGKSKFAAKDVFEAKIPRRLLKHLPPLCLVQGVVYNEERNGLDTKLDAALEYSQDDLMKCSSLEVLFRYAEKSELTADEPVVLAQAIADGFIYRIADSETKKLIVGDGLAMVEESRQAFRQQFTGQQLTPKLPFRFLLHWANRVAMHGGYNNLGYFYLKDGLLNKEGYRFIAIDASHLKKCREMTAKNKLIDDKNLWKTANNIESWLIKKQHYRRISPEVMKMLGESYPDFYGGEYQEYLKESDEGRLYVGKVNGKDIHKGEIFSGSFAIDFLYEHGEYFGNCVDVTTTALVFFKALGVPAMHICYGIVAEGTFREIHSFPVHYVSAAKKWFNYEHGGNPVYEWAKMGAKNYSIFYYYNMPQTGADWNMISIPIPGLIGGMEISTRDKWATVSEEEWVKRNAEGFADIDIK